MAHLVFLLTLLGLLQTIAAQSVCNSPPYRDLLYLSQYPPAETFCQRAFPRTVTITANPPRVKRTAEAIPQTSAPDPNARYGNGPGRCVGPCSAWTSASRRGAGFISTLCSCIEPPTTVIKTRTTTTTATTTTTSAIPTVIPSCPPSGQLFRLTGPCGCVYRTECDPTYRAEDPANQVDVSPRSSYNECALLCDNFSDCGAYSYRPALQECFLIKIRTSFGSRFWAEGNSGIRESDRPCGPANANCRTIFSL